MTIDKDPGTVALLDQFEAEAREAEELVPLARNRRLRTHGGISHWITRALKTQGNDGEHGPVPVLRIVDGQVEVYRRNGVQPITDNRAVTRCVQCNDPQARTVPFWMNLQHMIFQADLCGSCAQYVVFELEAEPQTLVS